MTLTAGVIAVQGAVRAHADAFSRFGEAVEREVHVEPVRTAGIIPRCDVISIPGGESTTISRLIDQQGLSEELRAHVAKGKPILATCAGLIVLAANSGDERVTTLDLLDIEIERNAFGRQRDSFEASIDIEGLDRPFPGVFIRAPVVSDPRDTEVLAIHEGQIVAVRAGAIIATAFHPELTTDPRIHVLAFGAAAR